MSVFAISDLHLSFQTNKPMDIFGKNWENYEGKIKENWIKNIKEEDLIILSGDFSWAINIEDTYSDFEFINNLPGKKLLLKGNHDYWWTSLKKMRQYLKENNFDNIDFIYNNSFFYENHIICGTRGWITNNVKEDEKIFKRELIRLELSIKDGIKKYGEDKPIIVSMHYPPITKENTEFIKLMNKYNIQYCVYGHLHGESQNDAIQGEINKIKLQLVSCDYTKFQVIKIV